MISEWMSTSTAYRAYRRAADRCMIAFAPITTAHAAEPPRFSIIEQTDKFGRPSWVVREAGKSYSRCEYWRRDLAEVHAAIANGVPVGSYVRRETYRPSAMSQGSYWVVTYTTPGDPRPLKIQHNEQDDMDAVVSNIIEQARAHMAGSAARITAETERVAAQKAADEERAERIAATKLRGRPTTPKQAEYLRILGATEKEIESLTVSEASSEIDRRKRGGTASLQQVRSGGCRICGRKATMWASLGMTCDDHYDDLSD